MYKITDKKRLNEQVVQMDVLAPDVAHKVLPGQFIILRIDEMGERIPLTVADFDREAGWVRVIFQEVGKTTKQLGMLETGDSIIDFVGPLGIPSHFEGVKKVCVIGGGLGCAIAYPQAKALHAAGAEVDVIVGFRTEDLIILKEDFEAVSANLYIVTDDGSYGKKGLVTDMLRENVEAGKKYDLVVAIGPLIMMKFVALYTKEVGIKTIVSMNPIMIDGTGMCGGCRLTVGGKTKFACVDGPDFDGHQVDFDEAMLRSRTYAEHEREADCQLNQTGDDII